METTFVNSRNAKARASLKQGDVASLLKMRQEMDDPGNDYLIIEKWTLEYSNGNLSMAFSIKPKNSVNYVTCCLSGILKGETNLGASWVFTEGEVSSQKLYDTLLFTPYAGDGGMTRLSAEIAGYVKVGQQSLGFNFTKDFQVST